MEFVERFMNDPDIALGFLGIIAYITNANILKKTIRCFTRVYHHTLRLLSLGKLEEEKVMKSWTSVIEVVDRLLAMVRVCDNKGVVVYIIHFLEAAITAHLSFDLTSFPAVYKSGRKVIKIGFQTLKELVSTPFVGGSAFNFAFRTLISIACHRPKQKEPIKKILREKIEFLPRTLYHHNVESLYKTLDKGMFYILHRKEKLEHLGRLTDTTEKITVSAKNIAPYAHQLDKNYINKISRISDSQKINENLDPQALERRKKKEHDYLSKSISIRECFSSFGCKEIIY
ncbi:UNVERIFIED_CONTAM: hypothetical protein RMT77_012226 [Armadillidium vulgare]